MGPLISSQALIGRFLPSFQRMEEVEGRWSGVRSVFHNGGPHPRVAELKNTLIVGKKLKIQWRKEKLKKKSFQVDKKLCVEIISIVDCRLKKMDRNAARKQVAVIVKEYTANITFSKHALKEMEKDDLTTADVWNVLKSNDSKILDDGELVRESFRYRLETNFIMVVIAFHQSGKGFNIVTVWDKRK